MINLITGLPGGGKTLYAIDEIRKLAEKEKRQVYFSGIADLKLPWIEHDPLLWMELPPGSIIVIDEAQRTFRPRSNGSVVPKHVEALETHRHLGIDIYVITQHPMLLDGNLRKLVNRHLHIHRIFGAHASTVFEWTKVKDNCDKHTKDASSRTWKYPKDVFDLYKSAEVHTHKLRLPREVWYLLILIMLFVGGSYYLYSGRIAGGHQAEAPKPSDNAQQPFGSRGGPPAAFTPLQYAESFRPRIEGLAYTAPAYDQVTKPTKAPYPAACVSASSRCQCYTQQGTKLETTPSLCLSIVAGGFFMAWDEKTARHTPTPVHQSDAPKLGGGNVDGLINLTPGYQPRRPQADTEAAASVDGAGIRAARGV